MNKHIRSSGNKGGTGKSTFLIALTRWLKEFGIEPYLVDADDESRTLSRYFPDALKVEPRRTKAYDIIINLAERGVSRLIIADLKAGTGFDLLSWFADVPFEELAQIGISVVLVGLVTQSPDSVSSLLHWVDGLGKQVKWAVVKNFRDCDEAANLDAKNFPFPAYDGTRQALEFRRRYRPTELLLRKLDPEYMAELERVSMTISDVLARRPGVPELLTPLIVRAKLRNYQAALFQQFEKHKALFLPEL